jgi:Tol biopolymer transport system component/predicted Ser/Thr protein kinase
MALSAGARVGPYEILSRLGAGGMGEVWKAHDSRLGRTVAIKFCHHQFSDRFEREARIIAHLNHPNICTLYDVGPNYLVMELVEGQPLQGPVPLLKAVSYVSQICDALDAAHRAGVTHRDLKPGNVLLARDRVKLLDFGLAKIEPARITPDDETVTNALTARGTILGTPQYMAPEQIEGRTADSRSDIFALGCIIYELITGKRAFDGKSASVIAGAILAKDPAPMRSIEPLTPPLLEQIVASCLAKDPETRFQSARDVNLALAWLSAASGAPPARMARNRVWLWVGIGALASGCLAAALVWRGRSVPAEPIRIPLATPGFRSAEEYVRVPQPSPDGTKILFTVFNEAGRRQLAVSSLDTGIVTLLALTEDTTLAVWGPDSQSIAFIARGKLRRISTAGGNPQVIADMARVSEAAWGANGEIIYAPNNRSGLFAIPESGGSPVEVTKLDLSRAENSHRNPVFLPDGDHFLFSARSTRSDFNAVYVGSRSSKKFRRLDRINSNAGFAPVHGTRGWLVYARDEVLFARMFDLVTAEFSGTERRLVDRVVQSPANAAAAFQLSSNGRLMVYSETDRDQSVFQISDRAGHTLRQYSFAGRQAVQMRVSPDGGRLLFSHPDEKTNNRDIWMLDLERDTESRLTSNPASDWFGVWAPDGEGIYFASDRTAPPKFQVFYKRTLEPGAPEEALEPALPYPINDISNDGRWALLSRLTPGAQYGLMIADLRAKTPAEVLLDTEFDEPFGRFSPNGHWLGYESDENGRFEVYVRRIIDGHLDSSPRITVSRSRGEYPAWNASGSEMYYLGPDRMLYAIGFGGTGPVGDPQPLFRVCGGNGYPGEGLSASWDVPFAVVGGGQRFVLRCRPGNESTASVFVFRDWAATLRP